MATVYTQATRRPAFRDVDGFETIVKAEDAIDTYTIDWSGELGATETIASATWTPSGLTVTGDTIASQTTYATIAGTNGHVTVKIVTSVPRTFVKTLRFIDSGDAS